MAAYVGFLPLYPSNPPLTIHSLHEYMEGMTLGRLLRHSLRSLEQVFPIAVVSVNQDSEEVVPRTVSLDSREVGLEKS